MIDLFSPGVHRLFSTTEDVSEGNFLRCNLHTGPMSEIEPAVVIQQFIETTDGYHLVEQVSLSVDHALAMAREIMSLDTNEEANATICAAAPDLLEVLKLAVEYTDYPVKNCTCPMGHPPCRDCVDNNGTREWLDVARAAIAKATDSIHLTTHEGEGE